MSLANDVLRALGAYQLRNEGEGKYRCNSPLRPGANSHSFTLVIEGDEKGAFFDHVSEEKGSLHELAQKLGIDVPKRQAVASTKRKYDGMKDYALAHGVSVEALQAAGWKEVVFKGRPALSFPTQTGTRWRFLDGEKPPYISPPGYRRCWYGLHLVTSRRITDGQPLILCNGEISTVAAHHYGLAAACVTSGEKAAIPDELLADLKTFLGNGKTPQIIVAMDCDTKGQAAARGIVQQLRSQGYQARAVDLGLTDGGDLADFCMLHGAGVAAALKALPSLPEDDVIPTRNWVMITEDDLYALPPVEWLFPGEIPKRALVVVFGQSGAGKSFLSMDYALRLAEKERVVYCASEGESGITQRVMAWRKHHKLSGGKSNIRYVLGAVNLFEKSDFETFLQQISLFQPVMVVIDTLGMSMAGADENSARDIALVVTACKRIMFSLNCTVMLVHHLNKAGVAERGSGFLRNASDVMIKVSPEDDLVMVESSKTKDVSPFPTRYLRQVTIDLPGMVDSSGKVASSLVLEPAEKVIQTKNDRLTGQQAKALEVLTLEVFSEGAERGEIASTAGLPPTSMARLMSALLRMGYVAQPGGSRAPYVITDDGRKKLDMIRLIHDSLPFSGNESTTARNSRESSESSASSGKTSSNDATYRNASTMNQANQPALLSGMEKRHDQYSRGH